MTIEDAIYALEYLVTVQEFRDHRKAIEMAISALRAQQEAEKVEPLT